MTATFAIAGSGAYLPKRSISSAEIGALTKLSARVVEDRFGVRARPRADASETSSFMGAEAARRALAEAGWAAESLDVIIGACGVMEQPLPGASVLIQRRLGLGDSGIPAFDVNAACLSFLIGFDRALAGFALGEYRRALVVCADIASAALDYSDPEASVLFGDGAAAFALEAGGPHRRLAHRFRTWGEAADVCRLEAGGTRLRPHDDFEAFLAACAFRMDGPATFRATAKRFPGFLAELLGAAGVEASEIDLVVPHQASAPALEHLKRALPGGFEKTIDVFAQVGNQIAVSLPFALHTARLQGRIRPNETALLIGSSAGISLGGAVIRW